jgi:hypothetical protein
MDELIDKYFDLVTPANGDNPGGLDTYQIINVGVTDERGTLVVGMSTTRFRYQNNGRVAAQTQAFIDPAIAREKIDA